MIAPIILLSTNRNTCTRLLSGHKVKVKARLIYLGLGQATQQVACTLSLHRQDSVAIIELPNQVGMHGAVAEIQREALEGIQSFVAQQGAVGIGVEPPHAWPWGVHKFAADG